MTTTSILLKDLKFSYQSSTKKPAPLVLSIDELEILDGEKVFLDQSTLAKADVKISSQGQVKGEKIRVSKFKAKSRYRKTTGFRPLFHKIKIDKIDIREK